MLFPGVLYVVLILNDIHIHRRLFQVSIVRFHGPLALLNFVAPIIEAINVSKSWSRLQVLPIQTVLQITSRVVLKLASHVLMPVPIDLSARRQGFPTINIHYVTSDFLCTSANVKVTELTSPKSKRLLLLPLLHRGQFFA